MELSGRQLVDNKSPWMGCRTYAVFVVLLTVHLATRHPVTQRLFETMAVVVSFQKSPGHFT